MKHSRSDYDVIQDLTVASQLAALFLYGDRQINRQAVARQLASEVLGIETKIRYNDEPFFQEPTPTKIVPWNEPVFLLRAEDQLSDKTMDFWISEARIAGVDERLISLVVKHVAMMKKWPVKQLPQINEELLEAMKKYTP